jgi:hypothetical protein
MVSANQFREMVSEYLREVIDLEVFSNRFAVLFDDIEDSGDAEAIQLSYKIESHLADVSAGLIAEAGLREALISCLVVTEVEPEYRASDILVKLEATSGSEPVEMSRT